MGKANHLIRYEGLNYPTYYIEITEAEEDEDEANYYDFIEFIHDIEDVISENKWVGRDQKIIGKTDNALIIVANNEGSTAISILPRYLENDGWDWNDEEDDETAYMKDFKEEANKIMNEIKDIYTVRTYGGPWTSGSIIDPKTVYKFY